MRIAILLGAGFVLLLSGNTVFAQQLKLGLNPYTVQKSALLELNSTNQGLLLARITDTTSINTLSPPDGMIIFFTPTGQLMIRSSGAWQALTTSSSPVFSSLTAGSIPYIGTGGALSQNNANLFWDAANLRQGIGTNAPSQKLDVRGTIVSSATTYPNYAYNSANRMAFGETNVPANETGSVVQFGSGSSGRNMLFAFTKTNVNTSFFGNDGTQMMLGSEASAPITFRTGLVYTSANVMASGTERMRLTSSGQLGIGVTNPANPLVVKDTLEIRHTGTVSELLFSNTAGAGDFRIGSDGSDIFWQGGGGRNLQMGAFWSIILAGDRQLNTFPSFSTGTGNTGVLIQAQRDASTPLGIQANSATQTANLTEWRTSTGTVLNVVDKNGNLGIGVTSPTARLHLPAGTATAGTAPLKLTSGTNLTTGEDGAVEYNGTNYFVSVGTTRYTMAKTLTNTATLDFPNTAGGTSSTLTITVTGAADGDAVALGVPNSGASIGGAIFSAYVSSANTVTVKMHNSNGITGVDPPSGSYRVSVLKY